MTSMARSLTTELGPLQGLLFEAELPDSRSLEGLREPRQPPKPNFRILGSTRALGSNVNMETQVTFDPGAKLQISCVQSLVNAIGKHLGKSHHPKIPILSFSQAGLKAYPGAGQCHLTMVSPVWWLGTVRRKSQNSQRTGCSSELGREGGRRMQG